MTENSDAIAILGGTGDQGLGLALRFAKAGRPVVIGSRKAEKAVQAADEVRAAVPDANVVGYENPEATHVRRHEDPRRLAPLALQGQQELFG